jgi:probable HAF family extracellular repeat protein
MRTTTHVILVLATVALAAPTAIAQSFMGLGDLPGGDFRSSASDLSADGKFITGSSSTARGNEAFLWSKHTGMVGLSFPAGSDSSTGHAVSANGGKVIGVHSQQAASNSRRLFEWTPADGIAGFDPFPVGSVSPNATGISADGSAVVGFYKPTPSVEFVAFHSSGGTLNNITDGFADGVSADGTVVVGTNSSDEAYFWTEADGIVPLGFLPGGLERSAATGISADGQVIVGASRSTNAPTSQEAFLWTNSGGMIGLGDLPGGDFFSVARDTTADGHIVVGRGTTTDGGAPFIWDETNGIRNLVDVLTNDYGLGNALAGWDLRVAEAVSDDGTVIVGFGTNPDGNIEAWRAVLVPEPSSALLGVVTCLGLVLRRTHYWA